MAVRRLCQVRTVCPATQQQLASKSVKRADIGLSMVRCVRMLGLTLQWASARRCVPWCTASA